MTAKTLALKWFAIADLLDAETGVIIPIDIIDSMGVLTAFYENDMDEWDIADYDIFISEHLYTNYAINEKSYNFNNDEITIIKGCITELRRICLCAKDLPTNYWKQFKHTSMEAIVNELDRLIS